MSLASVQNREEALDYLEGYSAERAEELGRQQTRAGLVKSYLLETVPQGTKEPDLRAIFQSAGVRADPVDDGLLKLWDSALGRHIGLVETLLPRHPVLYSNEDSADIDPWVRRVVNATPDLDRLWLSGWTFHQLWQKVVAVNPPHRYGRLAFQHESLFEPPVNSSGSEESEDEGDDLDDHGETTDAQETIRERRASRFTVVERLDILQDKLPNLQDLYHPLYAISQLRFPATGRGGHDFYHDGKVTNRSDSFADHRAHLVYVLRIYKRATESAEERVWYAGERTRLPQAAGLPAVRGAPVYMRFSQELSLELFKRWISSTFRRKRNRFRLWGTPLQFGPKKVHVYGADRHLWQRLFLEITTRHLIAVLPEGTCGNTLHRLVTNVQQLVDPAVKVWVGDECYGEFVRKAADQQLGGPRDSV